ncbi:hypothetical protein [Pseudomonas sp. BF-R-21]|uniref:hypothetical protein n=1 Tax=Pseudomonas sp. BF-R-21 TaxID=2832387 RepID=UPI001CBE9555|nr:hypothetical protein [Pseudomonas sp. BF-R-21]
MNFIEMSSPTVFYVQCCGCGLQRKVEGLALPVPKCEVCKGSRVTVAMGEQPEWWTDEDDKPGA